MASLCVAAGCVWAACACPSQGAVVSAVRGAGAAPESAAGSRVTLVPGRVEGEGVDLVYRWLGVPGGCVCIVLCCVLDSGRAAHRGYVCCCCPLLLGARGTFVSTPGDGAFDWLFDVLWVRWLC
jgi:hypothetical protein